jgi:hypothetical protein
LTTLEQFAHFRRNCSAGLGGGEADIIVDEADDILDCASKSLLPNRPARKLAASPLSGGEKTLTCAALPRCSGASRARSAFWTKWMQPDEANIGRFVAAAVSFSCSRSLS